MPRDGEVGLAGGSVAAPERAPTGWPGTVAGSTHDCEAGAITLEQCHWHGDAGDTMPSSMNDIVGQCTVGAVGSSPLSLGVEPFRRTS